MLGTAGMEVEIHSITQGKSLMGRGSLRHYRIIVMLNQYFLQVINKH